MDRPERYYTNTDGVHIAYSTLGEGPPDILIISTWSRSIEGLDSPWHLRSHRFFSALGRLIEFDPRGVGVSDPVPLATAGNVDDWVTDALEVMAAAGADEVSLIGEMFGSHAAIRLASRYPERVRNLTLLNGYARATKSDGYPFGIELDAIPAIRGRVERDWGTGRIFSGQQRLEGAPDPDWAGRFERLAASPAAAGAFIEADFRSDARDLLSTVRVPTLVLFTGDLAFIPVEHSRYLAEHIDGAELVELPSTVPYWSSDSPKVFAHWLAGQAPIADAPEIASIMFTDIVDSTARAAAAGDEEWQRTLLYFGDLVEKIVIAKGGRIVKQTGDGHLLEFPSPRAAVTAAVEMHEWLHAHQVVIRSGLHTGEVRRESDGDLRGIAVNIAARVAALAGPGELLVSRTVADLLAGSEYSFTDRGEHELKGVPGRWTVLALEHP